jgi:hypothetical protein
LRVPFSYPLLALLAVSPGTAAAQGRLVSADLMAVVDTAEDVITVRVRYTLEPNGAGEVPLAVVRFGNVMLEDVTVAGRPLTLTPDASGLRPTSSVPLPRDDTTTLDITYNVRTGGAQFGRIHIPVLAVLWPPDRALAGVFVARVSLPAATAAFDAFPSTFRRARDADSTNTYTTELHVLPALITFTMAARAPLFGATTTVELLVCAGLVLVGFTGWRRFRSEQR